MFQGTAYRTTPAAIMIMTIIASLRQGDQAVRCIRSLRYRGSSGAKVRPPLRDLYKSLVDKGELRREPVPRGPRTLAQGFDILSAFRSRKRR